jgi:hypothetical protein
MFLDRRYGTKVNEKGIQIMFFMKDKQKKIGQRKSRAQSLVEFAITLPILLLLFSGLVEFGFALNYYLSLLDATRESARYYSNFNPFLPDGTDDVAFYRGAAEEAYANLDPTARNPSYQGRTIVLDPTADEVLVTVFSWSNDPSIGITRYPTSGPYALFGSATTSKFTEAMIEAQFPTGSPNAGLLLVEVHYHYNPILTRLFLREPLLLRAHTIMPLSAAEPVSSTMMQLSAAEAVEVGP